jgi:hypothetical protein
VSLNLISNIFCLFTPLFTAFSYFPPVWFHLFLYLWNCVWLVTILSSRFCFSSFFLPWTEWSICYSNRFRNFGHSLTWKVIFCCSDLMVITEGTLSIYSTKQCESQFDIILCWMLSVLVLQLHDKVRSDLHNP